MLQEYIDSVYTDKEIRRLLLTYLHNNLCGELHLLLYSTGPSIIRAEFYINVAAGMIPSVRRVFTDGRNYDGPMYGYALSIGARPEKLHEVIEFLRKRSFNTLKDYLAGTGTDN